jgi:protocatechuate 3,4-dioxygenase alpha subunit
MLEIWQPTAGTATAFARIMPSEDGSYRVRAAAGPTTTAPYLVVLVFMRGLLKPLLTRVYFPDDPRTATDPALLLVPPERRPTLIARTTGQTGESAALLEWNVVLQGAGETVFFEW